LHVLHLTGGKHNGYHHRMRCAPHDQVFPVRV
jgi:hypothetical protein